MKSDTESLSSESGKSRGVLGSAGSFCRKCDTPALVEEDVAAADVAGVLTAPSDMVLSDASKPAVAVLTNER